MAVFDAVDVLRLRDIFVRSYVVLFSKHARGLAKNGTRISYWGVSMKNILS